MCREPRSPRTRVEELGSSENHHDDRGLAELGAQVLEEIQLARRGPVDVLVDDHRRPLVPEALEQSADGEEQEPLIDDRRIRLEAEEQTEVPRRLLGLRAGEEGSDALVELGPDGALGIRVEDRERPADELCGGVVAGLLFVRQAAAPDHATASRLDFGCRLPREPRLADSGRSDDGHDMGSALERRLLPDRADQVELTTSADERPPRLRPLRRLGGRV